MDVKVVLKVLDWENELNQSYITKKPQILY